MSAHRSREELEILRQASLLAAETLLEIERHIQPGLTTRELDTMAADFIKQKGAEAAFKGYRGFPGHICTSLNEEVVHGIPGKKVLKEGDILSVDVGIKWRGYYGDCAKTMAVGHISSKVRDLMTVAQDALSRAITYARPEYRLYDISYAIQSHVESHGYSVVRDFVGHGIGSNLHEEPQVPNFGQPHKGPSLYPGMVLAIEPMVNEGTGEVEIASDGWTVLTRDRKLSCHFEHTVAITENDPWILSKI